MHLEFLRKLLGQHLQASPANQARPRLQVATPARGAAGTGLGQVSSNQVHQPNFNTAQLQVQPQHFSANLGVPYMYNGAGLSIGQGGQYNPGYTPFQNSGFGSGGNPQIGAYQDQPGQLNDRLLRYRIQPGQEWLP